MLRLGVLGCAQIARRSVIPAICENPDMELVAVASRSRQKAEEFGLRFQCEALEGYQRLLDRPDIEAVYIPLPTGLHDEWIPRALQAGKHVLAEKSLARDFSSAQRMVTLARENQLTLMENFMFLYHRQHQLVRRMIEAGEIGEVRALRSSFGFPPPPAGDFRWNQELGGGALLDAGTYTLRVSQFLLGPHLRVEAGHLVFDQEHGVDLFGGAFLSHPTGVFSETAFGFDNYYQCNYEIWGCKGKITAERAFTPPPDFKPSIILEKQDYKEVHQVAPDNHFLNLLKEFQRCIGEGDYDAHSQENLNQSRILQGVQDTARARAAR